MKDKTRTIFLMSVMSALAVSLTAASLSYAFTDARYVGGGFDPDSPYDDVIDFVGATKYIVSSPEELVNAIENGYSYIQIDEDAAEPFVINSDIADVVTNLVLDVNGKVVVRNSRNPLLDVKRNVSVVLVYDSSQQQTGGFYNPVGSALQASGGTLTVGTGIYESGPRSDAAAPSAQLESVDYVYSRTERANDASYEQVTGVKLPKIDKDAYYASAPSAGSEYIKEDTYLLYTVETDCEIRDGKLIANVSTGGDELRVPCNVASCDFYYYYPVGASSEGGQNYAVVYGYHDVKKLAETEDRDLTEASGGVQLVWPYAAVRSTAGNTYARGGDFATHFGTKNTYGIYSYGGTIAVGGEAGSAEPEFRAYGDGVCINMEAEAGNADVTSTLTIDSGIFSSEEGDTVSISGGKMTVYAGTFSKTGCRVAATDEDRPQAHTAVIRMQGGELSIRGSEEDKVVLRAGSETSPLENVFGIRAGEGTVSVSGCEIGVYGVYSAGVLSYNGEVNLQGTSIHVTQNNEGLLSSAGVSSERDESDSIGEGKPINMNGDVSIVSNGLGVTARGTVNVKGGTTTVKTTRGTGIYVNYGAFNVNETAAVFVESTIENKDIHWAMPPEHPDESGANRYNGVYVQSGSLIADGTLSVTHKGVANGAHEKYDNLVINSYAVRVEKATDGVTEVAIAKGAITNNSGGGVYVGGGSVTLGTEKSGPTITTTGTDFGETATNTDEGSGNWKFYPNQTGGHAVEVVDGKLLINDGLYTAALGNGILVRNGEVCVLDGIFQGNDTQDYRNKYGNDLPAGPAAYYALKLFGGTITTFGGTFGTYSTEQDGQTAEYTAQGSSAFVTGGEKSGEATATANIYGGNFVVSGQSGFSVYKNVALTFSPSQSASYDNVMHTGSEIVVSAGTTAIAIEKTTDPNVSVTIEGGKFKSTIEEGTRNGIWDSNPYAKLTIKEGTITGSAEAGLWLVYRPAVEGGVTIKGGTITGPKYGIYYAEKEDYDGVRDGLVISRGTFTGVTVSGLYFARNQWVENVGDGNVHISGGTFIGISEHQEGWGYDENWIYRNGEWWNYGAIGAFSEGHSSGLGRDIQITDFIEDGSTIQCFTNEILDREITVVDGLERNEIKINQTTCRYNKVVILPPPSS